MQGVIIELEVAHIPPSLYHTSPAYLECRPQSSVLTGIGVSHLTTVV